MIKVSLNGRKLFEWKGEPKEAAQIEQDVVKIAALSNENPETLWRKTLVAIAANGGRFFSGLPHAEFMVVISGLLSLPTHHPDHPGRCRDYLKVSNFDFDIKIDPENTKQLEVQVRAFAKGAGSPKRAELAHPCAPQTVRT
jgi:hypothetical protein